MKNTSTFLLFLLLCVGCIGCDKLYEDRNVNHARVIVMDRDTQQRIPFRIHMWDANGTPHKAEEGLFWYDHNVCEGVADFILPVGEYTYLVECGPEYARHEGGFTITKKQSRYKLFKLHRLIDMDAKGWWCGDTHVHRKPEEIERLMRAEDLHIAPLITWWGEGNPWFEKPLPEKNVVQFDENRFYYLLGGEDERNGGAFLFYNLSKPIDITWAKASKDPEFKDYPSSLLFIEEAIKDPNAWIEIEKPFWYDVPTALAHGYGDSIGIANNHIFHYGMLDDEVWGKHRDREIFPSPLGNAQWSQHIYYQILNTGLRIPPTAGSASGALDDPLGYNRVYVYLGDEPLTYDGWWRGLKAGRCFVTNGPMLLVEANGEKPGHVFQAKQNEKIELALNVELISRDNVPVIEIIRNGDVVQKVQPGDNQTDKPCTTVTFEESGWFIVRALTDLKHTYRFASTAPFYVEIGDENKRVSRSACEFFLDWVNERIEKVNVKDEQKREAVLKYHRFARDWWQQRMHDANAE